MSTTADDYGITPFLDRVTVTGIDDSISDSDLHRLAWLVGRYRWLEFGILLSPSRRPLGSPRFPSRALQERLIEVANSIKEMTVVDHLNLSAHLCGGYASQFLLGNVDAVRAAEPIFNLCQRIQINTHGVPHKFEKYALRRLVADLLFTRSQQVIIQYDGANNEMFETVKDAGGNVTALADLSHGGGIVPDRWARPCEGYCGYAGGLSAPNLLEQLRFIALAHGVADRAWIDAESSLFWNGRFDLRRVSGFALEASFWVVR